MSSRFSGSSCAETARSFVQFFRCPEGYVPFQSKGDIPSDLGFFRFGESFCFGRVAGQVREDTNGPLFEAFSAVETSGEIISIPFDITEIVENLQRERYLATTDVERHFRSIYYLLRPLIPLFLRRRLQQLIFRYRNATFPNWPTDFSVEQIQTLLMKIALSSGAESAIPFIWFWPEGKNACAIMTHDVEEQHGASLCDRLMDLDEEHGIRSSFQIVPEGRYDHIGDLIARITERGFEANIHDLDHDGLLYGHLNLFKHRAAKINSYAREYGLKGFRAGSMHRNQDWFHMLDFQYDMSVPNVSHLEPQRGGCCTVFPYFVDGLLELPLTTIQDHGLFNILHETSIDLWKEQIASIASHHGLISFIVHPDYIFSSLESGLYRELLDHLNEVREKRDLWLALPGEVNEWWRQRSQMTLVKDGSNWKIVGQGSERARLAYATLSNDMVKFHLADELESCSINT